MTLRAGQSLALAAWLVVLWCMLWADVSVANVVSGSAIAAVVALLASRISSPTGADRVVISPVGLVVFVVHVLWTLVKSNLFLAWEIVTPTNTIATGTVDVPLRSTSSVIAMAVCNVITLTPGTVTVGITDDSSVLTIGVLHLSDPAAVRDDVRRTERYAIRAFGTHAVRAALATEEGRR
jgi:multicomponent Na+:H+ antiporter subunit E